jgi:protein kinase-like protein
VLHRDIKPSNVLLEGRAPVLIDFGLARLAEDPRLTQTGWLLGTPGYLAPEILYGDDATAASDVHSWAATVVFAATGSPPFGKGPAMAIMDRVRRGEHDLSGVPASMLPLLRACLSPDPHDRPRTATVLAHLGGRRGPAEAPTVPVQQMAEPPTPTRTRHLTTATPARAPYQPPPQPAQRPVRRSAGATARLQRVGLLAGLFAAVTLGFALAPYLSLAAVGLLALVVRTISWTTESVRQRQSLRGRRRWFDAPLAVLSTPWYLVVATGGTVMLMLWSALLAFAVGFAYALFRAPVVPGLLAMGGVLALALWWGPGGRRVRQPVRRLAAGATRNTWVGWLAVAVVTAVAALLALGLLGDAATWDPADGPPWRAGTALGSLLRWM